MKTILSTNVQKVIRRLPLNDSRLQGILLAHYRKCFPGSGVEFEELQPYHPGDDVRTIDWKSSVRMNSVFVQKYSETFDNHILLAVDTSSSMNTVDMNGDLKLQTALAVLFTIAQTAFVNGDKVGITYAKDGEYSRASFTSTPSSLIPALNKIEDIVTHSYFEENDWDNFFGYLTNQIKERTICFVISDNFDFKLRNISKLKLATMKHTLIFVEVSSWFDTLNLEGIAELADIETGEVFESFLDNPELINRVDEEIKQQTLGVSVALQARYFKITNLNRITYDMIKLLSTRQGKFSKQFTP